MRKLGIFLSSGMGTLVLELPQWEQPTGNMAILIITQDAPVIPGLTDSLYSPKQEIMAAHSFHCFLSVARAGGYIAQGAASISKTTR